MHGFERQSSKEFLKFWPEPMNKIFISECILKTPSNSAIWDIASLLKSSHGDQSKDAVFESSMDVDPSLTSLRITILDILQETGCEHYVIQRNGQVYTPL